MADAILKLCQACKQSKKVEEFGAHRGGLRPRCKICHNAENKAWREANIDKSRQSCLTWQKNNPEKAKAKQERWLKANPSRMAELAKAYRDRNPEAVKATYAKAIDRRRGRPEALIHNTVGGALRHQIKAMKGKSKTFDILGYTLSDLMLHLERQFLKGMTWQNFGEWHIDHVLPLSSFSITGLDDPELRVVWGLPNLRPLWAVDNLKKRAKRTHLL